MAKRITEAKSNQGGHTRWKKGQPSPNPKGRKKGSTNRFSVADIAKAIKFVEQDKQQSFMAAWISSAWGNASDMSKIVEFMLPKLKSIEGLMATFESSMTDDLAKSIQDKLRKQYERK